MKTFEVTGYDRPYLQKTTEPFTICVEAIDENASMLVAVEARLSSGRHSVYIDRVVELGKEQEAVEAK